MADQDKDPTGQSPGLGSGPGSESGVAFETGGDNPPQATAVEGAGLEVGSEGGSASDSKDTPLGPGVPEDQSPVADKGQEIQENAEGPKGMMSPGSEDQGAG